MSPRIPSMMVLLLSVAAASPAAAHRAPSPTENNRYARITLLPDGVRVAYTVFFGERPGQVERRRMDTNRDGVIDDAEADHFAARLLAEIARWIDLEIDGEPTAPERWRVADLGLGTPTVNAGPFALDLQVLAPYPDPRLPEHTLWLEDRWPVASPGETEVRVEESPGVRVAESHLRRDGRGAVLEFRYIGAPKTKGDGGIFVRLTVDEEARAITPRRRRRSSSTPLIVLVVLVGIGAVIGGTLALVMRRRGKNRSGSGGEG